jgi:ABC-2 type transport system ATP-binding protein
VLVVDEPMVGLDPHSIRLVKDLLKLEAADGMCVLMSTHTLPAAEEISNRIGIMNHGRLVFDGTVNDLRGRFRNEQQSLEAMYLAMTSQRNGAVPDHVAADLPTGPPNVASEEHPGRSG